MIFLEDGKQEDDRLTVISMHSRRLGAVLAMYHFEVTLTDDVKVHCAIE